MKSRSTSIESRCLAKWANIFLIPRGFKIKAVLAREMSDGVYLINLLEAAMEERVCDSYSTRPATNSAKLDNVKSCFSFLQAQVSDFHRIAIDPIQIVNGDEQSIIKLMYSVLREVASRGIEKYLKDKGIWDPSLSLRKRLLLWLGSHLGLELHDFFIDFRDGMVFGALLETLLPQHFNCKQLDPSKPVENIKTVFKAIAKHLHVVPLLRSSDFQSEDPSTQQKVAAAVQIYICMVLTAFTAVSSSESDILESMLSNLSPRISVHSSVSSLPGISEIPNQGRVISFDVKKGHRRTRSAQQIGKSIDELNQTLEKKDAKLKELEGSLGPVQTPNHQLDHRKTLKKLRELLLEQNETILSLQKYIIALRSETYAAHLELSDVVEASRKRIEKVIQLEKKEKLLHISKTEDIFNLNLQTYKNYVRLFGSRRGFLRLKRGLGLFGRKESRNVWVELDGDTILIFKERLHPEPALAINLLEYDLEDPGNVSRIQLIPKSTFSGKRSLEFLPYTETPDFMEDSVEFKSWVDDVARRVSLLHYIGESDVKLKWAETEGRDLVSFVVDESQKTLVHGYRMTEEYLIALKCFSIVFLQRSNVSIDFSSILLTDDNLTRILEIIPKGSAIESFSVANNEITKESGTLISDFINSTPSLKELDISGNSLGDEGVESISKLNSSRVPLEKIFMGRNEISDDGLKRFLAALHISLENFHSEKRSITMRLDFEGNRITDEGCAALGPFLCRWKCVKGINLRDNCISDTGLEFLIGALGVKDGLDELLVGSNQLSSRGAQMIANALDQCIDREVVIDLSQNPLIGRQGFAQLFYSKHRVIVMENFQFTSQPKEM